MLLSPPPRKIISRRSTASTEFTPSGVLWGKDMDCVHQGIRLLYFIVSVEAAVNQMWFSADITSKAVNTLIRKLQNMRQAATVKVTDR